MAEEVFDEKPVELSTTKIIDCNGITHQKHKTDYERARCRYFKERGQYSLRVQLLSSDMDTPLEFLVSPATTMDSLTERFGRRDAFLVMC